MNTVRSTQVSLGTRSPLIQTDLSQPNAKVVGRRRIGHRDIDVSHDRAPGGRRDWDAVHHTVKGGS